MTKIDHLASLKMSERKPCGTEMVPSAQTVVRLCPIFWQQTSKADREGPLLGKADIE